VAVTAVLAAALLAGAAIATAGRRPARLPPTTVPGRVPGRLPGRLPAPRSAGASAWLRPLRRAVRRGSAQAATREALVELAEVLATELRAGRDPRSALDRAGAEVTDPRLAALIAPVLETARLGGDVAAALRAAAVVDPEARPLAWLAAAWQVAESRGAGLATAVSRVAAAGRADADHRRQVAAQLAAPRATARLLALLPVAGLGLGGLLGAGPVTVLLTTPVGVACLVLGVLLDLLGLWWTARIARSVERPP
jgi:tight adherence protein B